MSDPGLLETASPALRTMFKKYIGRMVAGVLGSQAGEVPTEVKKRLADSKSRDALRFLKEAVAREEDRNKLLIDPLTGLKEREGFEADLETEVAKDLKAERIDPENTLHVIRIDLGMLNAVNAEGGRPKGDKYKEFVAKHLVNPLSRENYGNNDGLVAAIYKNFSFFGAYIVGGDEFALVIRGRHDAVVGYLQKVEEKLKNTESEDLDLLPSRFGVQRTDLLDWGIAEFNETMKHDFLDINEKLPRERGVGGTDKRCAKFLNEIADTLSDMRKMFKRITLLVNLQKQIKQKFDKNYFANFSKKATGGISSKKLRKFSNADNPNKLSTLIRDYVRKFFEARAERNEVEFQDAFASQVQRYIYGHVSIYVRSL